LIGILGHDPDFCEIGSCPEIPGNAAQNLQ
jgi:hypothetical protein